MPKISVVMSTYNEQIDEASVAIESILNQTFTEFEFIIILDNPNNYEIRDLLLDYQKRDSRIVLVFNEENIGLPRSLNKGITIAKAPYIARMDADDIAFSTRLEEQYNYMEENKSCGVLGTNTILMYEGDKRKEKDYSLINRCNDYKELFMCTNAIAHPTAMIRTDILKDVGGYRDFKAAQDYDLWLRLLKKQVEFAVIEKPLLYYCVREDSISQSNRAKQRAYYLYARFLFEKESDDMQFFNEENREEFFGKVHLKTPKDQTRYNAAIKIFEKSGVDFSKGKRIKGIFERVCSFFVHKETFSVFLEHQKYKKFEREKTTQ